MNIDERLDRISQNLDTLTKIHLDNDREYRERFDKIAMSLESLSRDVQTLNAAAQHDGENIRALARIAEIHERRLTALEGGDEEV
jgi:hypothetical protein